MSVKLDRIIDVQARKTAQDETGEPLHTWDTIARLYANRSDIRGQEYFAAQQEFGEVTTRFIVRYSKAVATYGAGNRILFDGDTYEIVAGPIHMKDRNRFVQFMAKRITSQN